MIRKLKRKVRKLQQKVPDDAPDASGATSENPTEEVEEEKARRQAGTQKKQCLLNVKGDAEKENQAQLLSELAHYRLAEEERWLAREAEEAAAATAAAATAAAAEAATAKGHPLVDPSQPTLPFWQVCLGV